MSDHTTYAVPKDRQYVTVRLSKEVALEGEIFLEYTSDDLSRHQKISAFLENSKAFFPLKKDANSTEFISKKNVRMIKVTFPENPETNYFSLRPMHAIPVIALFSDGEAIRGRLLAEAPDEKARLSDCLNMPDKFLNVRADGAMYYINKDALQKVTYDDKT